MLKVKKRNIAGVREPSTDSQQSGSASGKSTSCLSSRKQIQKYKYPFYLKCVLAFYLILPDTWDNRLFSLQWKKHPLKATALGLCALIIIPSQKAISLFSWRSNQVSQKVLLSPDFSVGINFISIPLEVLISVWIILLLILLVCEPLRVFLYD